MYKMMDPGKTRFAIRWSIICLMLLVGTACRSNDIASFTSLDYVRKMVWQDNDHLWVCTDRGITRWDRALATSTVFNDINCEELLVAHNPENVWGKGGRIVAKFDGKSWQQFKLDAYVYNIVQTHDGTLWAGTKQGLAKLDIDHQKWEYAFRVEPRYPDTFRFSIGEGIHLSFQASDGALWFASENEPYPGVTRWTDTLQQTWRWEYVSTLPAIPLLEAHDGSVWAVGDQGVIERFQGEIMQEWLPFGTESSIVDLTQAHNGDIWAIPTRGGVARWDGRIWHVWAKKAFLAYLCPRGSKECLETPLPDTRYYPADGLGKPESEDSVLTPTDILGTSDGSVWVATNGQGISRWTGQNWRNYTTHDGLSSESISVLVQAPDGTLWAGTWEGNINYYNSETDRWQSFPGK